jgi:dolichol-phosphate mannosyltransferase
MSIDKASVLIILPVLNEVTNIVPLLERIHQELDSIHYTVCVIDDGSKDGTIEILHDIQYNQRFPIHLIERRKTGYGSQRGSALRVGMEWGLAETNHQVFVEMDGDLSHRPEDLKAGIRLVELEGYDVAIASKFVPGSQVIQRTTGRNLVSLICSIAVRIVINSQIKDYSNGYRFYTRRSAELLTQYQIKNGSPIYLSEVLAIWLRNRLRIVEFPFTYVGRNEGLSKLRFTDLLKAAIAVFEIGWRYHFAGFQLKARGDVPGLLPDAPILSAISDGTDVPRANKRS